MVCFHPLKGWASRHNAGAITFNRSHAYTDLPRTVPCGQCSGCRLERSRQWAIRCHHEASLHENNCFITLTYNEEHMPDNGSLDVRELQLFFKRLRKKYPHKIRYYACGEYGPLLTRPHYHACLFGHAFEDMYLWDDRGPDPLYRSPELEKLWRQGFSTIGSVTFKSAAYVARYIMKKMSGDKAADHYGGKKPEFTVMSTKPGIGSKWEATYRADVYPDDFVVINGKKMRPPRFYDKLHELGDPNEHARLKRRRKRSLQSHADNNTPERLTVRQKIQDAKLGMVPREYEEGTDE